MATFKEAFRKARKEGLKTFTWKGDKYTTKLASKQAPSSSPRPKARPSKKSDSITTTTLDPPKAPKSKTPGKGVLHYLRGSEGSKWNEARRKAAPAKAALKEKGRTKQRAKNRLDASSPPKAPKSKTPKDSSPKSKLPKSKGFKEAFRAARKRGDKTFMWKSKKYTTKLKE